MKPDDPTAPPTDPPDGFDHDDDLALGPLLGPDAEADPAERARARGFAELIDKMMTGRTPAVVPTEDQGLLEVATAIRATVRPAELAAGRRRSIVESALAAAIDRKSGGATTSVPSMPVVLALPAVAPIEGARVRRRGGVVPWMVAAVTTAVAAAAIAMLVVDRQPTRRAPDGGAAVADLPFDQRSRPADPLVGAIPREGAGLAVERIDAIYADRLGGFRARTLYGSPILGGGTP